MRPSIGMPWGYDEIALLSPSPFNHTFPLFLDNKGHATPNYDPEGYTAVAIDDQIIRSGRGYLKYYLVCDEYVLCRFRTYSSFSVAYVQNSNLTRTCPRTTALVGSYIVGNVRYMQYNGAIRDLFNVDKEDVIFKHDVITLKKDAFPLLEVAQIHHTLIRPHDVLRSNPCSRRKDDGVNTIYSLRCKAHERCRLVRELTCVLRELMPDITQGEIATHMVYATVAPLWAVRLLLLTAQFSKGRADFYATLKEIGLRAKQSQHIVKDATLSVIYELQVLENRSNVEPDWAKERHNRTTGCKTIPIPPEEVTRIARGYFIAALSDGLFPKNSTWEDYWDMRWGLTPVGSFFSQHDYDNGMKGSFPVKGARNKTTILSTYPKVKHDFFLDRPREIYARASTKYEWGKTRAIYSTDITTHLHMDFAMRDCEKCLPSFFSVGKNSDKKSVAEQLKKLAVSVPLCYDYDDFNSQHSFESMIAVVSAWEEVFGPYLSEEQRQSIGWVKLAIPHQFVKAGEEVYKTSGTMFSGWRLTSFINTILNRVYLEWSGLKKHTTYSLHNGDDVIASCETLNDAYILCEKARGKGLRAQINKMNLGTIAEFLRMDGTAKSSSSLQYLTRAVATATHARLEADASSSLAQEYDAINERMTGILTRGGDERGVAKLQQLLFHRTNTRYGVLMEVTKLYHTLHRLQGGVLEKAEASGQILERYKMKEMHSAEYDAALEQMRPGMSAYLEMIAKQMDARMKDLRLARIKEASRDIMGADKYSLRIGTETRKQIKVYMALHKAHKEVRISAAVSKMKLLDTYDVTPLSRRSQLVVASVMKLPEEDRDMWMNILV